MCCIYRNEFCKKEKKNNFLTHLLVVSNGDWVYVPVDLCVFDRNNRTPIPLQDVVEFLPDHFVSEIKTKHFLLTTCVKKRKVMKMENVLKMGKWSCDEPENYIRIS